MSIANSDSSVRKMAGCLSRSALFARARRLYELNQQRFHLPLSKLDKILVGSYLILSDYAAGQFPPSFDDEAKAHQAEIDYNRSLAGATLEQVNEGHMRKPFWDAASFRKYSTSLWRLLVVFEQIGLKPGSRLLEFGCGGGWMAEFLALAGYSVTGTTIAIHDIQVAELRALSFHARQLKNELRFRLGSMESADEILSDVPHFDGVFIFEALHHAFDWRKAIHASYHCLNPRGWLVLANEPNLFHTFKSYRVGKLSNTHEIGLSRRELVQELKRAGFAEIRVLAPRINNLMTDHWIAAKK